MSIDMDLATLKQIVHDYQIELVRASSDKKTSLPFIKHHLSPQPLVIHNQFNALVIGGSIGKMALIRKTKQVQILRLSSFKLPMFKTKQMFLDFIQRLIDPDVKVVALNFAFALQPILRDGKLDGLLLEPGTKGHMFHGLYRRPVGATIEDFLWKTRKQKIAIAVANDTICLLLSGLTKYQPEEIVAGVVGTGFNLAFFFDSHTAVNLEAAHFDKFPQSEEGKRIDAISTDSGRALFEKEIAGAYLYQHFNLLHPGKLQLTSTEELNQMVTHGSLSERKLARALFKKSAQLVACHIAGLTSFKRRSLSFVMEGSLFWNGWQYRETVLKTLQKLIPDYQIRFTKIDNSDILGCAYLVT